MSGKLSCLINNTLYPTHGGDRNALIGELGVPDEQVLDFSASVVPFGSRPEVLSTLGDLGRLVSEYPEPNALLFSEKVSKYLKVPSEWVFVTNGSTELIHLLPRLVALGEEALVLNPCFSEYERGLELSGIHVNSLHYDPESLFQMNPESVIDYLHQHSSVRMLILGHPNNPTGHLWDDDVLKVIVQYCESQKIILVVDETFVEFCGETVSALKWVQDNRYVIVVRSMTKFFGLAGVRLGYGVMHPDIKTRLKKYQIPWSVNAIAQKMGILALADEGYLIQTRKMMDELRTFLFSELNALSGIRVFPSQTNFLLFQLLGGTVESTHQFYMSLLRAGILIRNCGNFKGLDESYFRVAVRAESENQVLISAIKTQLDKES
jgi:threonine-phosphate decarboxylase